LSILWTIPPPKTRYVSSLYYEGAHRADIFYPVKATYAHRTHREI
jgi:hypothetical protein